MREIRRDKKILFLKSYKEGNERGDKAYCGILQGFVFDWMILNNLKYFALYKL